MMYVKSSKSVEVNCEADVEHDIMECNHYVITLRKCETLYYNLNKLYQWIQGHCSQRRTLCIFLQIVKFKK